MSDLTDSHRHHGVIVALQHPTSHLWLLVKRASTLSRAPNKVGFPGGALEPNESQPDAIVREMLEELSIRVTPLRPFWQSSTQVPGFTLHGWLADFIDSPDNIRPNPAEVQHILWLTPQQAIQHPDAFPANADFIESLLRATQVTPTSSSHT